MLNSYVQNVHVFKYYFIYIVLILIYVCAFITHYTIHLGHYRKRALGLKTWKDNGDEN
jgi:hypothetical protein